CSPLLSACLRWLGPSDLVVHFPYSSLFRSLKQLALALKPASNELKGRIRSALTSRAAEALQEEVEYLGPQRMRDIEAAQVAIVRSEEHTSELQSREKLVCRLLLDKKTS